jgi:Protein of unknown function DUF262
MIFSIRQSMRPISWFLQQREFLDLDPPYQRRPGIWSSRTRERLIDSVLNRYDLPKFYLADLTHGGRLRQLADEEASGISARYAVIDGKQRIQTIFEFTDDQLRLARDFVFEEAPEIVVAGSAFSELLDQHPALAQRFLHYEVLVADVITDDEARISSLFVRLNTSQALTGAEVRNAMEGEAPVIIRRLAGHAFFESRIRFQVIRGQDWNAAAKILLLESLGHFTDTKKRQLDQFVAEAKRADRGLMDIERAEDRAELILDRMVEVFRVRDPLLRSQGPVILYYWFVREYGRHDAHELRAFLEQFNDAVRVTRRQLQTIDQVGDVDADLALYASLSRSTNDQSSLERRYEVLTMKFAGFLDGVPINQRELAVP